MSAVAPFPAERRTLVDDLLHRDPFAGYDEAIAALEDFPGDVFLRQAQARALAKTASPLASVAVLESLYAEGNRDAETLGLLGSAWKQIAEQASGSARQEALEKAYGYYLEGLEEAERTGDFQGHYPGVNAAALSVFLGDTRQAESLASRTVSLLEKVRTHDYWTLATAAEATLIQGRLEDACTLYREAQRQEHTANHVATTRRQAVRLAKELGLDGAPLVTCLHVPPVLVFIGHLTDWPDREEPRFPEEQVSEVAQRIDAIIARTPATMGFAAAARGGDLLFLESLKTAGVPTRIVLPLEPAAFRASSVDGGAPSWGTRFEAALDAAASVRVANTHSSTADGAAFEYGTRILIGLARIEAQRLETELRAIALWDGKPGDGHGGTAWAVSHLCALGVPVENVYPGCEGPVQVVNDGGAASADASRPIRAMLFSDCRGYSKLREEEVAEYTLGFLRGVARLIERSKLESRAPIAANTWGDGLFLVFEDVGAAAVFASDLRDGVMRHARELGIPTELRLRIGLHAGPVTPFDDPIIQRQNFAGMNVAFTARIEPIAPENEVCVSEAFAALATDSGMVNVLFDYLGVTPFAKGFGKYPLYVLRQPHA